MANKFEFRKGEMLEVVNTAGALIAWGSFESEDDKYTYIKQVLGKLHAPYWTFDFARYPSDQFAFVRIPGRRGDRHLIDRALRQFIQLFKNRRYSEVIEYRHPLVPMNLPDSAAVELELARIYGKTWKLLRFPRGTEVEIFQQIHDLAIKRLVMNPDAEPEIVIKMVTRGRWNNQLRDEFLEELEKRGSPHLNLLREAFSRKRLKNEGRERPEPFIGL